MIEWKVCHVTERFADAYFQVKKKIFDVNIVKSRYVFILIHLFIIEIKSTVHNYYSVLSIEFNIHKWLSGVTGFN